jgi:hypothetical protein
VFEMAIVGAYCATMEFIGAEVLGDLELPS